MCSIAIVNIKHKPTPSYDLYIGRTNKWLNLEGSKWQNPFVMKRESEREDVLRQYKEHILSRPDLIESLPELCGLTLGCYCFPKRCHGNILVDLYNEFYGKEK